MEEVIKRILNYLGPKFIGSAIICLPVLTLTALLVLGLATYRDQPFSFLGLSVGPSGPRNVDFGALAQPVGSITAYYGDAKDIPANWKICDGSVITDHRSKFLNGKRVPDLTDNRFLMGVREIGMDEISQARGGSNDIPGSTHSHVGTATQDISHLDWGEGKQFQRNGPSAYNHTHPVNIPESGLHNHGGENRPRYQGVLFIIRLW